jgi:zinc protease
LRSKFLSLSISFAVLVSTALPIQVAAQSGRKRDRVPMGDSGGGPPPVPATVPETTVVDRQEQAGDLASFALHNGISVVINELHALPTLSIVAYVKTGQLDDAGLAMARTVELTLPLGTQSRPAGQIGREIAKLGGTASSTTDFDHTAFAISVPAGRLQDALSIQADMIQHPTLAAADVTQAYEEAAVDDGLACADPYAKGLERVRRSLVEPVTLTANATNGQPITADQAAAFYGSHYKPENLIVSVAGDVSTFDALVAIQRLYGQFGLPSGDVPKPADVASPRVQAKPDGQVREAPGSRAAQGAAQTKPGTTTPIASPSGGKAIEAPTQPPPAPRHGLQYNQERGESGQAVLTVGYRGPGWDSQDRIAISVLCSLVGQGRGCLLSQVLMLDQAVAGHIESRYQIQERAGAVSFQVWLNAALLDKAEAGFFKLVADLIASGPGADDLARAKARAELDFELSTADYSQRASTAAQLQAAGQAPLLPIDYVERMRSVTAEDVRRVAAKYLTLDNLSVEELEPNSAPPRIIDAEGFKRSVVAWAPGLAQPTVVKEAPVPPANQKSKEKLVYGPQALKPEEQQEVDAESIQPLPVRDFSTLNGPLAFVREDHSLPLVTVAILFEGGRVTEDESNSGITRLMLQSIEYGSPRMTPQQAAAEIQRLGADLNIINEPDYFGFTMTVLSGNSAAGLKLLRRIVEEPGLRDADIERARAEQTSFLYWERDSGSERSRDLLMHAMFPGHSYGFPRFGLETSIAQIKPDQVREWYNRTVKKQYPVIAIVGDTDGSSLVSEGVAGQFSRQELAKVFQAKVPSLPAPAELAGPGVCPVSISEIGGPAPKVGSDDLETLAVTAEMLKTSGGLLTGSSQLFADGGAYLNLSIRPMLAGGVLYATLATKPENEQRARRAFVGLLQKLASQALSEEDIETARLLAAHSAATRLASRTDRALAYGEAVYEKREASTVDSLPERLSKIRTTEVRRVLSAYFKPSAFFVSTVRGTPAAKPVSPQPSPTSSPAVQPPAGPPK